MRKKDLERRFKELDKQVLNQVLIIEDLENEIEALRGKLKEKVAVDTVNWKEAHKQARLEAADEFCWFLTIMMGVGGFEDLSFDTEKGKETRAWIGKELKPWIDNAWAPWEDEDEDVRDQG